MIIIIYNNIYDNIYIIICIYHNIYMACLMHGAYQQLWQSNNRKKKMIYWNWG